MKLMSFCLLLAAMPGFSGERQSTLPVVLYTKFEVAPSTKVVAAVREEVDSIMAPVGLHFEWRSLENVKGNEIAVELAVISFKGRCDVNSLIARNSNPGALGWTHVSDGIILPFSDVDCDRIRQFIQKDVLQVAADDREAIFGRALARVLAHELYHVFANTGKHGACGVGKSAYSVQDLLSDEFVFEARNSVALKKSKAIEHLENAAKTALDPTPPL